MGDLRFLLSPSTRRIPRRVQSSVKLLSSGLLKPFSRCMIRTAFRYCRMEVYRSLRDKYAAYRDKSVGFAGTGA